MIILPELPWNLMNQTVGVAEMMMWLGEDGELTFHFTSRYSRPHLTLLGA